MTFFVSSLADLVLKDKIFVYDLAHQRIGWANYDCKFNYESVFFKFPSAPLSYFENFSFSGSLSVNVSVTSSKDEYINAGQLSESSSSGDMLFKLLTTGIVVFLMHILVFVEFHFL